MAWIALGPLTGMAIMGHFITKRNVDEQIRCELSHTADKTRQKISFFIEQRKTVLTQVAGNYTFHQINSTGVLNDNLSRLDTFSSGFLGLVVIDQTGIEMQHAGLSASVKKDNSNEEWFRHTVKNGTYISEIYLDAHLNPHFFIAVRQQQDYDTFFILRATVSGAFLNNLMDETQAAGLQDVYLISRDGLLQTQSYHRKSAQEKINLPPQLFHDSDIRIMEGTNSTTGGNVVKVYADIPATPYILMLTEAESVLLQSWYKDRRFVFWFLGVSLLFIAVLVYATATKLVNEVFIADQQRIRTLREMEHSNKLASIGRLAAGVGHEINNPLAIINEKAGLIQDILTFNENYKGDVQLAGLTNAILTTVKRCGTITRRLLDFARHLDGRVETVNIKDILGGILDLLHKESIHRRFTINIEELDSPSSFECDQGKLQQIFLNLINNSFAAMEDGGTLTISIRHLLNAVVEVTVSDDGCGIAEEAVDHIFEPFFFTISQDGGTGLGLSVTYALVQEIGGSIKVRSEQGKGTQFTVEIPHKRRNNS